MSRRASFVSSIKLISPDKIVVSSQLDGHNFPFMIWLEFPSQIVPVRLLSAINQFQSLLNTLDYPVNCLITATYPVRSVKGRSRSRIQREITLLNAYLHAVLCTHPDLSRESLHDLPDSRNFRSEEHTSELQSPCNLV